MSSEGSRFCPQCGASVEGRGARAFCTECGARLGGAMAPAHVAAAPARAAAAPSGSDPCAAPAGTPLVRHPEPGTRRGTWVVAIVLGGVLLGGGGTTAAVLLGSEDPPVTAAGDRLAQPIDAQPEQAWTYDAGFDNFIDSVTAGDGTVFVTTSDGSLVALEAETGTVRWRREACYVAEVSPDGEQVLASDLDLEGVTSLSAENGATGWSARAGYAEYAGDAVLLRTDEAVRIVDATSGEQLWEAAAGSYDTAPQTVYVVDEGELRAFDLEDGVERWSQYVGYSEYVSILAVDEMVTVHVDATVTGYAAGDGSELWSSTEYADFRTVEQIGPGTVAITTQVTSEDTPTYATIYDRSGEVDRVSVVEGYLGPQLLLADGETYALTSDGRVLDQAREVVAEYDGYLLPVDGGIYSTDDLGDVSFYALPAREPAWTEPWGVSSDSGGSIVPIDGGLAVLDGSELRVYR